MPPSVPTSSCALNQRDESAPRTAFRCPRQRSPAATDSSMSGSSSCVRDTLNAFVRANLVREYDPVEALAGLGSALGSKANENRRREALTWAFTVWRSATTDIQDALRNAKLHVADDPAAGAPPRMTAFSASWTSVGLTLENFLVEASQASADCRRARDALLTDFEDWPTVTAGTKRRWLDFLALLGVGDGLKPVGAAIQESGEGWSWRTLAHRGDAGEALDQELVCGILVHLLSESLHAVFQAGRGVAPARANRTRRTARRWRGTHSRNSPSGTSRHATTNA